MLTPLAVVLSAACIGDSPMVTSCVLGSVECGAECADLASNPRHCGACNAACRVGEYCEAGLCVCPAPLTVCTDACADLQASPQDCGACGTPCSVGEACTNGSCTPVCAAGLTACAGRCVDTRSHRDHCGGCDQPCATEAVCVDAQCHCAVGLT
ncbi:MAG TPA: MXAN_6577-like cysteine-rich protein, partial [Polyangiaceae bacterium]|nr:MXAN_6577-like cysteine-rich protein [Polyangiaceae bacterium]